ncbi:phosphatase PAP2 family protein [bacterium]|nr:phosphatase PAP2 family protein [bacterium]
MHLPLLHISSRKPDDFILDEDPLKLGQIEGKDIIPWLANPFAAFDRALRRRRSLDVASLGLAAIGSEVTYFAILSGLFSAFDKRSALTLAGVIIPSVTVNQFVKAKFRFKRPPRLAMHPWAFVAPGDYTFPSGHAQNAVAVGIFIAQRSPYHLLKLLGITAAVSVPLSRVYLGVHYPRDVVAGSLLGLGSVALANIFENPFREWWLSSRPGARGFTTAITGGILGLLTGTPLAAFPLAVGGGLAMGHDLAEMAGIQEVNLDRGKRWVRGLIGVSMFMSAGFAIRPLLKRQTTAASIIAGGLVGVTLTFGVPFATSVAQRSRQNVSDKKSTWGIFKKRLSLARKKYMNSN